MGIGKARDEIGAVRGKHEQRLVHQMPYAGSLGGCLRRHEPTAQQPSGVVGGLLGAARHHDPARFAASARVNLGLHDKFLTAQLPRGLLGFFKIMRYFGGRNWDSEFTEDFLGLVLVKIHFIELRNPKS